MNDEQIKELTKITEEQSKNIDALTGAVQTLGHSVKNRPTKKSAYGFSLLLNFIMVAIILVGGAIAYRKLDDSLNANKDANASNAELLTTIKDCLSPTGNCYQQGEVVRAQNRLAIICNEELIVVGFVSGAGGGVEDLPYQPLPECIPSIEQRLGKDLFPNG